MLAKLPRFRVLSLAMYGFVCVYSLFVLVPLLWMIFAAFKTKREIFTDPLGLPDGLTFVAFGRSWGIGLGIFLLTRRW
jgi:ABC-type glycerol-3-phosphate transport system permease component